MSTRNSAAAPFEHPVTHEGSLASPVSDTQALLRATASCLLWEDQFYESGVEIADRIHKLTLAVPPAVASAIAVKARSEYKLRHVPLWIAKALASGNPEQRKQAGISLAHCIQRPDELCEFLALYWAGSDRHAQKILKTDGTKRAMFPLPSAVKRALALAFTKFDAYQLAKYNWDKRAIKLKDVLRLVHPKPTDAAQSALWKSIIDGTVEQPDTWENKLSSGAGKKETFERLLIERKLGALALLRNLRGMQEADVQESLIVMGLKQMRVERVLPFRFITAARYAPHLEKHLEDAMFRCLADAPKLAGRTALIVDTSPSMWQSKVSAKSEMTRFDAAAALAILCSAVCEDVKVYAFNHQGHRVPPRSGFALRDALAQTRGDASAGGFAVDMAQADGYDRIVVLTDGQWHDHKAENRTWGWNVVNPVDVCPKPLTEKAFMLNVAAYRNAVGNAKHWQVVDGWSEAVVEYIREVETILP